MQDAISSASSHLVTQQISSLYWLSQKHYALRRAPLLKTSFAVCRYFADLLFTVMLRIRKVSGKELTATLEEDLVPDVRALKPRLSQLYGLPPRFGQRLLLHGKCLDDGAGARHVDLHPYSSPDEVQPFTAAAHAGNFDKVRALKFHLAM